MAATNYKPVSYPKLETRIVNGKSARVEIYHGRIIRVYDDNNKIVDDRTTSEEKNFSPLLRPKVNKDVYQINEITSESIDKEPVLKIPSFFKPNTPEQEITPELEIKADLPVDGILNSPMQENQLPEQPSIDQKQKDIMEPDLSKISNSQPGIEEGKSEIKPEIAVDSHKPDDIKDIVSEKDTGSINQEDSQKVEVKDQEKEDSQKIEDSQKLGVKDQEKEDSQKIEDSQKLEVKDQEKEIVPINQELIATTDDSQKIEIKDQPQIQNKEQNKDTSQLSKDAINDIPNIITDSKLPISEGTTPPTTTSSIFTTYTTPTISKLSQKLKPIFGQNRNVVNNTEKDDNIIYNSEHGKLKEKANNNKEDKSMAEEVLEEYKRNKWAEDRDYKKNIEEMARTSLDNKEKIADISEKLTGVEGKLTENMDKIGDVDQKVISLQDNIDQKVGNIQDNLKEKFGTLQNLQEHLHEHIKTKLGEVKRPVSETLGELCTGIDCIKEDLKKNQESSSELDKKMDSRFSEIRERIQKLEVPTYVCDNCGYDELKPLSSFCPNCGTPIYGWSDPETGNPVAGWSPYWKRGQRAKYPE